MIIEPPNPGDCDEYYTIYTSQVPPGDVLSLLADSKAETHSLLSGLTPEQQNFSYAPGKWNVREVVGHMIDVERVFSYRAFSMARSDPADLPDMDQDAYAAVAHWGLRTVGSILSEMEAVRKNTLSLFRSFTDLEWARTGTASGKSFKVSTFPFIILGHELHHKKVLREKYLS